MRPAITITMATFNVVEYIEDCLESIYEQSFNDFEFICIDDASTDGTMTILNQWAAKYSNMILIAKSHNEGLSIARNEAIKRARGKYICFVDGDDIIDRDLLRQAFIKAEEVNSDMVFWDYLTFSKRSEIIKQDLNSTLSTIDVRDRESLLRLKSFVWTKLIRTDLVRDLGIVFPPGKTKQDIPVHWNLMTNVQKIAVLPYKLSYYRLRNGATSYRTDESLFDVIDIMNIVKTDLMRSGKYEVYWKTYTDQRLALMYAILINVDYKLISRAFSIITSNLDEKSLKYAVKSPNLSQSTKIFYAFIRGIIPNKWVLNLVLLFRFFKQIMNV